MAEPIGVAASSVAGFIDLGTNSVRLLLVRLNPSHSYTVLTDQKEMIRLGEGEFEDQMLRPEAMQRAVLVCRKFAELARAAGAREIVAVATSATREARNQREFLQLLRRDAGLDVRVISGREEARLIYLGVSSGIHLNGQLALFIDIGGGSTEISLGNEHEYLYLDSLKLGAIRLTTQFLRDEPGPIGADRYAAVQQHVRHVAVHTMNHLRRHRVELAIGSSGTIENLAEIAVHLFDKRRSQRDDLLTRARLKDVVGLLRSLSLAERRKVPGINPERADIIIAGAAIVETLMDDLRLDVLRVSNRGLRDGLLIDYLARSEHADLVRAVGVRERSVLQLARNCGFDEAHARTVAHLADELYESGRAVGLHAFGEAERELLRYAALLHDVGSFLSYSNHHAHSYYLVRNADLLGFDQREIAIIAAATLYHRKALPRAKHPEFASMDKQARKVVPVLSLLIRLAESLDRGHLGVVRHARWRCVDADTVALEIEASGECQLELWGTQHQAGAFAAVFGRRMVVSVHSAEATSGVPELLRPGC